MTLSAGDDRAPFEQVAGAIRTQIQSGALTVDSKLPSIRNLAQDYGVAVGTAQAAVDLLRSEGYVYAVSGRGTFVRERDETEASPTPSPEYAALAKHVSELDETVRRLTERLELLEHQASGTTGTV